MRPLVDLHARRTSPPAAYWLIPLTVAALRAIPFLASRLAAPPPDSFYPPFGYNPIDGLAYVGFIRQAAETGDWLLVNAHTTQPQDGRYFLPLFSLLGWVCRLTGLSPFTALELARVPLVFAFFAVFWRFAGDFLPDRRQRLLAAMLVAFAGGVEFLAHATLSWWPAAWHRPLFESISDDYGWSTFAALFNPLWGAGLTLALLALRPVLKPKPGPRRSADNPASDFGFRISDFPPSSRAGNPAHEGAADDLVRGTPAVALPPAASPAWRDAALVAGWTVATYLVHPYSGLGVLAISGGVLLMRALSRAGRAEALRLAAGLTAAVAVIAGFSAWQHQDAVFHATARGLFGPHGLSVLWYPLTLGATGGLAALGAWQRGRAGAPGKRELLVWAGVAALLHWSPWTSGYHFVYLLPLPLGLLAAPALDALLRVFADDAAPLRRQFGAALVVALAFQSAPAVTWRTTRLTLARPFPTPVRDAMQVLAREPAARVYASPHLGLIVPAYTAHRVVVGHWFLTPQHATKQARYNALMAGLVSTEDFLAELRREAVRYVLLPPRARAEVVEALTAAARQVETFGDYRLFRLQ